MDYQVTVPDHMTFGETLQVVTEGGMVMLPVPSPSKMPADRCVRFQGPPVSPGSGSEAPTAAYIMGTSGSQAAGSGYSGATAPSAPLLASQTSGQVPPPQPRESRPPRRPRYSVEVLPVRRPTLRKKWTKRQAAVIGGYLLAGLAHGALISRRVIRHYLIDDSSLSGELGTTIFFWIVWVVTLLDAIVFLWSDPRDQGGEAARVRCSACKQPVRTTSKHCFQCNECIVGFDHHCYYLNMCVGKRNYKSYFVLINGACIAITTLTVQALIVGIKLLEFGTSSRKEEEQHESKAGEDIVGALCIVSSVLFMPGIGFLGHLCCLHYYLCWKGITTFEYWMGRHPRPFNARALTQSFLTTSFTSEVEVSGQAQEVKAVPNGPSTPNIGGRSSNSLHQSPSWPTNSSNHTPRSGKTPRRPHADSIDSSNSALASRILSSSHKSLPQILREEAQWATYGPPMPADPPVLPLEEEPEPAETSQVQAERDFNRLQEELREQQAAETSSGNTLCSRPSCSSRPSGCIPISNTSHAGSNTSDVELRDSSYDPARAERPPNDEF